jgi:hypothetical protein
LPVPFCLSRFACPVLPVTRCLAVLFCMPALPALFCLSCSGCPVLFVPFLFLFPFLSWLSWLSFSGRPVLAVLIFVSCHD